MYYKLINISMIIQRIEIYISSICNLSIKNYSFIIKFIHLYKEGLEIGIFYINVNFYSIDISFNSIFINPYTMSKRILLFISIYTVYFNSSFFN